MSKSLNRVKAAMAQAGLPDTIRETGPAKTAQMAADIVGCVVDQIGKSIIVQGHDSGDLYLCVTAGGNTVDMSKVASLTGESVDRANAQVIRDKTGFAIGGVSPIGHLSPITAFFDPRLLDFDEIWVAAGTPNHLFSVPPHQICDIISAQPSDFVHTSK